MERNLNRLQNTFMGVLHARPVDLQAALENQSASHASAAAFLSMPRGPSHVPHAAKDSFQIFWGIRTAIANIVPADDSRMCPGLQSANLVAQVPFQVRDQAVTPARSVWRAGFRVRKRRPSASPVVQARSQMPRVQKSANHVAKATCPRTQKPALRVMLVTKGNSRALQHRTNARLAQEDVTRMRKRRANAKLAVPGAYLFRN